jgi:hypothetical protein
MILRPTSEYRSVFKLGMPDGWDIQTIQIAINSFISSGIALLVEDGSYGSLTDARVRSMQKILGIKVDGIVGQQTQIALCDQECIRYEVHVTPRGLLRGICHGESGCIIPTTSVLYTNKTRDYGPLQDNIKEPTQTQLREAYSPGIQAKRVGKEIRNQQSIYFGQPGAISVEKSWRLAVLHYNWPAASDQIAAGHGNTWTYAEYINGPRYSLADNAPWINRVGKATQGWSGWRWCESYINTKVIGPDPLHPYVTSWIVV